MYLYHPGIRLTTRTTVRAAVITNYFTLSDQSDLKIHEQTQ